MRRGFSSSLLMGLTAGDYERHNLSVLVSEARSLVNSAEVVCKGIASGRDVVSTVRDNADPVLYFDHRPNCWSVPCATQKEGDTVQDIYTTSEGSHEPN